MLARIYDLVQTAHLASPTARIYQTLYVPRNSERTNTDLTQRARSTSRSDSAIAEFDPTIDDLLTTSLRPLLLDPP